MNNYNVHEYRGISYRITSDDYGQCYVVEFLNTDHFGTEPIGLGTYNMDWQREVEDMIDHDLDYLGSPGVGVNLKYNYYRDIELYYRDRLVKVYLKEDWPEMTEDLELDAKILIERLKQTK